MIPLWQHGYAPSGRARAEFLRDLRLRLAETARLEIGFFQPWAGLRRSGESYVLTYKVPAVSMERICLHPPELGVSDRFALARSLVTVSAAFEARGVRFGPPRPEALVRLDGCFAIEDPLVLQWLLPRHPAWKVFSPLNFLAPEILRGEPPTAASDRFSLGATLYWLFTGLLPFDDADERYIPSRTLVQDPVDPRYRLPLLPATAATAILGLLDRVPERRPAPRDLVAAFPAKEVSQPAEQRRWCTARHRVPAPCRPRTPCRPYLAGGAACLLLLAVALARWAPWRPPATPPLARAGEIANELYQARNIGDYASMTAILSSDAGSMLALPANAAVWDRVRRVEVAPGANQGLAKVTVWLEEVSLIQGVVKHWAGMEVLEMAAGRGGWRITRISRSGPAGRSDRTVE